MSMVIYLRRATAADIARLTDSPSDFERFAFEDGDQADHIIDFDKAWDALDFLLTGTPRTTDDPLAIIAADGELFGVDEHGFGGFSIISPDRMAAFARALEAVSDEQLAARYDPAAMEREDIYLADFFVEEGADALDYILQGVPALRRFAASCAAKGEGALRILA